MVHIRAFTFNPLQENTYILSDETGEAVIIDPGCYEPGEQSELKNFVALKNLDVKYILNTHCHIDHVLGNDFAKNHYQAPLLAHALELFDPDRVHGRLVLFVVVAAAGILGIVRRRRPP